MKRILSLLLALCCLLSLCACGSGENGALLPAGRPGRPQNGAAAPAQNGSGTAASNYSGKYHRVAITADNWADYFELKEIPLYTVTQGEVIAQVCQNFCVVLREEYLPYLNPNGNYRVEFSFRFDLYIDTMDINTNEGVYGHTDDLFYAVETTKNAVFDRYALPSTAYGGDASLYEGFSNAFFTGYCSLHPESRVWSGFYIDLSQVTLESVSGELELGG